jgi:transcriptional regulator with XRE-family HTH domain
MSKGPKSDFELYVINKVKEKRVALGMSQDDLSELIDADRSFIGQVESPNNPAKYNLNHLNMIAMGLGCSPKDFIPESPIPEVLRKKARPKRF